MRAREFRVVPSAFDRSGQWVRIEQRGRVRRWWRLKQYAPAAEAEVVLAGLRRHAEESGRGRAPRT